MRFKRYLIFEASKNASKTTRLQECLHCIGLGIYQIKKKAITIQDIQDEALFRKAFDRYVDIDTGYNELYKFVLDNPNKWVEAVVRSTNALKKSKWMKKNNYTFYRGVSFMNIIYNEFNKLKKRDNISLANDKWNPSDIWASSKTSIPSFDSLIELNQYISKSLKSGDVVGISLKKSTSSPVVEWYGPDEKPEIIKYKGISKPKGKNAPFPTGITINTSKANINFRSFRIIKAAPITGEIIGGGKAARGGKVPSSIKKDVIDKYKISQMSKSRISSIDDNKLKEYVSSLWKQCGHNFSENDIAKGWSDREKNIQDRTGYWMSIINSLEIGSFLNQNKSLADNIITKFYTGSSSKGSNSSEFIKVS